MPYSPEHKARTRQRILTAARRMFNRRGFSEVSIEQVMAGAGLTRGGFYSHFENKEQLYAEAIGHIFADHPSQNWDSYDLSGDGPELARAVVESYLSDEHFNDIDMSCPLIALPSDTARSSALVRAAYRKVLEAMVGVFECTMDQPDDEKRSRALAAASLCVGGMVLARAIDDRAIGDEIRGACRAMALDAGGWARGADASANGHARDAGSNGGLSAENGTAAT